MDTHKIGILHPGNMGISVAASAVNSGQWVFWASEGRSKATRLRAQEHSLVDLETLDRLCGMCDVMLAICPPHAAEQVAQQVIGSGFRGLYCDGNAIAPPRAQRIGEMMCGAGIDFVDGGIIGGPAWERGETWLYLSGKHAREIADCFSAGPLEIQIIGDEIGKASALKMCYSAFTKGSTALLCAVLGASDKLNVRAELYEQWTRDGANLVAQNEMRACNVTYKAWRFEGEMREIAATFGLAGMPEGFHLAAAEIYRRLSPLKESGDISLDEVLSALGE